MGGQRTVYTGYSHEPNVEDDARSRAIVAALHKPISMSFANETPLENVIRYIKSATQSPELPTGIPIYVDPVGLNDAEKTMASPITLDLERVALHETLRVVLKQVGLMYSVGNGLLTITSERWQNLEYCPTPVLTLADKAVRGELSLREMNELIEVFKARRQIVGFVSSIENGQESEQATFFQGGFVANVASPGAANMDGQTEPVLNVLERVVPLHFQETPIQEALAKIREITKGAELPAGLPVYVNPRSLPAKNADVTVSIDLDKVKLKTGLRLILGQVGLAYIVKEELVIIDRPGSFELYNEPNVQGGTSPVSGPANQPTPE